MAELESRLLGAVHEKEGLTGLLLAAEEKVDCRCRSVNGQYVPAFCAIDKYVWLDTSVGWRTDCPNLLWLAVRRGKNSSPSPDSLQRCSKTRSEII